MYSTIICYHTQTLLIDVAWIVHNLTPFHPLPLHGLAVPAVFSSVLIGFFTSTEPEKKG